MKSKELFELEPNEANIMLDSIHSQMTEIGYEGLVKRMCKAVDIMVEDFFVDGENFKDMLLDCGNYTIVVEHNKVTSIKIFYSNFSSISARLNSIGLKVIFEPEHGDSQTLLNIDGFEEFLKISTALLN